MGLSRLTETGDDEDESCSSSADRNQGRIVWGLRDDIAWHLTRMETFASLAIQEDCAIAKDIVDEAVHGGFGECTALALGAFEGRRTPYLFFQEVIDVCLIRFCSDSPKSIPTY